MKVLEITTRYELVVPLTNPKYYYIRITSSNSNYLKSSWAMGYENSIGGVSIIGGSLAESLQSMLENNYQNNSQK